MGSTPVRDSENYFSEYFHLRALLRYLQQGLFGKVHVGHAWALVMWEAWTNTDSTFLRYPCIFCRIMHTKQICSQESIGALYWYHRLTLHWHCAWHSIDTWLTSRSRIDIFNQCIWVGEHSADYWPMLIECQWVSLNFYSFVYVLFDCHMMYIVNSISSLDELFLLLQQMLLK